MALSGCGLTPGSSLPSFPRKRKSPVSTRRGSARWPGPSWRCHSAGPGITRGRDLRVCSEGMRGGFPESVVWLLTVAFAASLLALLAWLVYFVSDTLFSDVPALWAGSGLRRYSRGAWPCIRACSPSTSSTRTIPAGKRCAVQHLSDRIYGHTALQRNLGLGDHFIRVADCSFRSPNGLSTWRSSGAGIVRSPRGASRARSRRGRGRGSIR
jgi:hypothetical protein